VIKGIAGHQRRRWSSKPSPVIKAITDHQRHRWSSRALPVMKDIAGRQRHRWSSRAPLVIRGVADPALSGRRVAAYVRGVKRPLYAELYAEPESLCKASDGWGAHGLGHEAGLVTNSTRMLREPDTAIRLDAMLVQCRAFARFLQGLPRRSAPRSKPLIFPSGLVYRSWQLRRRWPGASLIKPLGPQTLLAGA
jgi:hypothetical protein